MNYHITAPQQRTQRHTEKHTQKRRAHLKTFLALLSILLMLPCFYTATADIEAGVGYQEIRKLAKGLKQRAKPEETEKRLTQFVEKSRTFIAAHPDHRRVDEVHHLLGTALIRLAQVEAGVAVFKAIIEAKPNARYVERCLLDLGLAYDRLGDHDTADGIYQQLIEHPKFSKRSRAKLAKKLLEQDRAHRKGELPKPPSIPMTPNDRIGQQAPDFQATDLAGTQFSLEDYRGQVVLLDFWATWCPPCIAEIPNIKKTHEKYRDQKFQVIGISLDRAIEPLTDYIEKEELGWLHYWDKSGVVGNLYKVRAIPSTFLLDGAGVIRKTNLRGPALEAAVAELVIEMKANTDATEPLEEKRETATDKDADKDAANDSQ